MATQDDKNRELRASVEAFRHAAKELQRSIDNANALLGLVGDAIDAMAELVEAEPDKEGGDLLRRLDRVKAKVGGAKGGE